MTVLELYNQLAAMLAHSATYGDYKVVIHNNKPSVGPQSVTKVTNILPGIDWDRNKMFIIAERKMTEL